MEKLLEMLKEKGVDLELFKTEFQAALEEEVTGLKNKNKELLGKLHRKDEGAQGEAARLEEENINLKSQLEDLTKKYGKIDTDFQKKTKEYTEQITREKAAITKLLVDQGLTENLIKIGVRKEHIPALRSALGLKVQIKEDGENRIAMVGEKPLNDWLEKEWASSEEGKAFLPAPNNSGSGSTGGAGGGAGAKTMKRSEWDVLPDKEKATIIKSGTQITD